MTDKLFAVDLGLDFAETFVTGLLQRFEHQPTDALARAHVIVNTARMQRRITQILTQRGAVLHPRLHVITNLHNLAQTIPQNTKTSNLAIRLELVGLINRLLDIEPDLAARSAAFDLADSLANLMDEIQNEGVDPEKIAGLEVTDQSGHWDRTLKFVQLIQSYLAARSGTGASTDLLRTQVLRLAQKWQNSPVLDPVIVAGSTGSRGATLEFMQAVMTLPQGMVVLPGYDRDMPPTAWDKLRDPLRAQDHPQYRLAHVADQLNHDPADIPPWAQNTARNTARTALMSLALRPAPVTDSWLAEGPNLADLQDATRDITWVNAPSKRSEALAIALKLREAVDQNKTVAVITPDRQLTRQITAALSYWDVIPDDSAGTPLQLSPPGRFLRHVINIMIRRVTTGHLLALLKHPLTNSGADGANRGTHLRLTRELELYLRSNVNPYPTPEILAKFADKAAIDRVGVWVDWVTSAFLTHIPPDQADFDHWIAIHKSCAERIAGGPQSDSATDGANDSGELWLHKAGKMASSVFDTMAQAADSAPAMSGQDYANVFSGILAQDSLRDYQTPHENIMILGTLEARVQTADTIILASLNEGTWPEPPSADPWFNRAMRQQVGLLLPDRQIGLSAHDFQTSVCLQNVWITRSLQSDDVQTVPSRWINRLQNLLNGLPDQGGKQAMDDMIARGQRWLDRVTIFDHAPQVPRATRPSVVPPVDARPTKLSVTEIKTLIRDPYAIYAKHVLRIVPLDDLDAEPDARLRGTVMHDIFENFINDWDTIPDDQRVNALMERTHAALEQAAPWALTRIQWANRIQGLADWFVTQERQRRLTATPIALERKGRWVLPDLEFTLTGKVDRLDDIGGQTIVYDYKTGTIPTGPQQLEFDKQLYLLSLMVQDGAFDDLAPAQVADAAFLAVSGTKSDTKIPLDKEDLETARAKFYKLIAQYQDPNQGYTARRALFQDRDFAPYDPMTRFGEWSPSDDPMKEHLT